MKICRICPLITDLYQIPQKHRNSTA